MAPWSSSRTHPAPLTGPARVFDTEEAAFEAVKNRQIVDGDVLIIRYEGPVGGPGMREMLQITAALFGQGLGQQGRLDPPMGASPAARAA